MRADGKNPAKARPRGAPKKQARLSSEDRLADMLERAADHFAAHGLGAQTRQLAEACGVSQRLLYHFFPTKAALVDAVYRHAIERPFDERWLSDLAEPSGPPAARVARFYKRYAREVLTERWLRLFLHGALADSPMASAFTRGVTARIIDMLVVVIARDLGLDTGPALERLRAHVWVLHGSVVHAAIRVHVYRTFPAPIDEQVVDVAVEQLMLAAHALRAGRAASRGAPSPQSSSSDATTQDAEIAPPRRV